MHRPLKAIVVEDDPTLCRLFAEALTADSGITAGEAHTLADGVALARAERHMVFLVDLGLPDASGVDAIGRLRRELPGATVIVVTGNAGLADDALEAGAHAVIIKASQDSYGAGLINTVRQAVANHENELYFAGANRAFDKQKATLDSAKRLLPTLLLAALTLTSWSEQRADEARQMRHDGEVMALTWWAEQPGGSR